jgi:hypothetical protein
MAITINANGTQLSMLSVDNPGQNISVPPPTTAGWQYSLPIGGMPTYTGNQNNSGTWNPTPPVGDAPNVVLNGMMGGPQNWYLSAGFGSNPLLPATSCVWTPDPNNPPYGQVSFSVKDQGGNLQTITTSITGTPMPQ